MEIKWPLQAVLLWALFSSDSQLLTTKLNFDFIKFVRLSFNLTAKFLSSSFSFSCTRLLPVSRKSLPSSLGVDVTDAASIPFGILITFLNSLFSNPFSFFDRCRHCKVIFSGSKPSEISSGLYWFSGSLAILNRPWEECLRPQNAGRSSCASAKAMSLHKSSSLKKRRLGTTRVEGLL